MKSIARLLPILILSLSSGVVAQEPTFQQLAQLKRIRRDLNEASRLLDVDQVKESARLLLRADRRLSGLTARLEPNSLSWAKSEIEQAGALAVELTGRGQAMQLSHPWDQFAASIPAAAIKPPVDSEPVAPPGDRPLDKFTISFRQQVVPILVAKCGRCHIDAVRGRVNMATYDSIMSKPDLVLAGDPENSEMVSLIVAGEMPRGRLKVEEAELTTLRQWIMQGATCDEAIRTTPLKELVDPAKLAAAEEDPDKSGGDATGSRGAMGKAGLVSFSKQVAPVLIDTCAACHIDARNVRGGLNLATFAMLSTGGDSGALFTAGAGDESLLVMKLRGTAGGMQMPAGRNPLPETTISLISQWIDEGAKFDGFNPAASLRDVYARARAGDATHEELAAERQQRAVANWNLVLGGKAPVVQATENFLILTAEESAEANRFGEIAESVLAAVAKQLRVPSREPLVKGKIAAYLFQVRYDYSEFGKMIEKRDLPREWNSHWANTTLDAYVVFQAKPADYEALRPDLAKHLTAIYLRGLSSDVPAWFAEGYGIWVAARIFSGDDRVKAWESKSTELLAQLRNKDDFLNGRLADDDSALVGYQFIQFLKANGSSEFSRLLKSLRDGDRFDRAFSVSFGATPQEIVLANSPAADPGGNPNNRPGNR
jgi:hypothetical protein